MFAMFMEAFNFFSFFRSSFAFDLNKALTFCGYYKVKILKVIYLYYYLMKVLDKKLSRSKAGGYQIWREKLTCYDPLNNIV